MLKTIGSLNKKNEYIKKYKGKKSGQRTVIFGYRIYEDFNSTAVVMKEMNNWIFYYLGQP